MQVHLAETASTCLRMQQRSQYATSIPALRGGSEISTHSPALSSPRSFEFLRRDNKIKAPMVFSDVRRRID